MSFLSYLRVELRRIFVSPFTWLMAGAAICSLLAGYSFFKPLETSTRANTYIANPVYAGTICGTLLFAILTLYELDRVHRNGISEITDSIVSPTKLNVVKIIAILITAGCTGLIAAIVYLPYTLYEIGYLFEPSTYLGSFLLILLPGLIMSSMLTSCFYLITRRTDLSFFMVIVCALLCFGNYLSSDFILRWINPTIPYFSDMFTSTLILRTAFYNRLFWLVLLSGLLIFSLLFVRRYCKGCIRSFFINMKTIAKPLMSIVLILAAVCLYRYQPFSNHAPLDFYTHDADTAGITVNSMYTEAQPNTLTGTQRGTTTYSLSKIISPTECHLEINCGYKIHSVIANGEPVEYTDLNNDLYMSKLIQFVLPEGTQIELVVKYSGYPQIWSATKSILPGPVIGDGYIELLGASFAPLIRADWGLNFNNTATVILPDGMIPVVVNGSSELIEENSDGTRSWKLERGRHTMIYMYASDYVHEEIAANNLIADFYYFHKNKPVMDKYGVKDVLREVFDFCSETYGKLTFVEDDHITLLQHTGGGGYASNGMSVIGELSFTEDTLKDAQRGASGREVMAHEIIHQWWGLAVPFYGEYTDSSEWTSEGFTVYSTYRLAKKLYGEEYAKMNYTDKWQEAAEAHKRNFYNRNLEYLDLLPEQYAALIRSNETFVNRYNAMPLKILKASELIGGEEKLDEIMSELFKQHSSTHSELSYTQFLSACGLTEEELTLE